MENRVVTQPASPIRPSQVIGMKSLILNLLALSLFLLPKGALAAQDVQISSWLTETGSVIFQDYKNYYSTKNLAMLGLGLGVGGALANTSADREVREWYQDSVRSNATDDISEGLEYLGRGLVVVPCFAGAAILGELIKETQVGSTVGEWGTRSLRTLVVGGPPALLLHYTLGGSRPGEGSSHWSPFEGDNGVSGHSFLGAVPFIVAAQMSSSLYSKIPLYLASTLVGLSRINDDLHYLSQVALGWSLAYLAAASVDQTELEKRNLSIVPAFSPRGVGLQVVLRY